MYSHFGLFVKQSGQYRDQMQADTLPKCRRRRVFLKEMKIGAITYILKRG